MVRRTQSNPGCENSKQAAVGMGEKRGWVVQEDLKGRAGAELQVDDQDEHLGK
jgi:hypothetical protein